MKKYFRFKSLFLCLPSLLCLAAVAPFITELSAQKQKSGISLDMERSIRFYNEGEDAEAMDGFIHILVKGSPAEKALANDYITKISMRMNTGVNTIKDAENDIGVTNTIKPGGRQGIGGYTGNGVASQDYAKSRQQEAMAQKINSQMAQMRRALLLKLGQSDAVKVYMGDSMPKAITLDTNYFFAEDTAFRPGTEKLLSTITGLIFTLGRASCIILPEGAAGGDVKIKNIRRVLAINSYLEARGVSKSKLELNLTGSNALFPKNLDNMGGIIMLFDYEKELRLKDLEDFQTKGPKVSLGVYPTAISVQNNQGSVVEFSVFESPVGQPTWSFQVFRIQKDGSRLQLQEISGNGAQYNQSFWNGRNKFFGAPYPSGKYMFTVTAKDVEGRETSISRMLAIRPTPEEEKVLLAALVKAKEGELPAVQSRQTKPGAGGATGKNIKSAAALKKARTAALLKKNSGAKKTVKKQNSKVGAAAAGKKSAAEANASGAGAGEMSGRVSYKIYFKENTATITTNSEKKLAQVAETLGYYPLARIALTGYAYSGESNAETTAEGRVNYVVKRLVEKYKIDQGRMDIKSSVSETPKSTVEIQMTGSE